MPSVGTFTRPGNGKHIRPAFALDHLKGLVGCKSSVRSHDHLTDPRRQCNCLKHLSEQDVLMPFALGVHDGNRDWNPGAIPTGDQQYHCKAETVGRMRTLARHQSQRMLAPTVVFAGFVRTQMHDPISGGWQPVQPITAPLTHQHVGIPLSRAYHTHQRPIPELRGHILTQLFERALAVIENQGEQHPAKDPEMTRLNTAKNGLELVERIVYVDGDACERPHGLGSCVVLGFRHLPRYTGAIIFPVLVRGLTLVPPPTHPSLLRM